MKKTLIYLFPCLFILVQGCSTIEGDDLVDEVPCDISENYTFVNDLESGVDYIIDCETYITADVIIEAGTVIEFTQTGSLIIANGGSLKAILHQKD